MDPIEESVRRALEGGDPADHAFRRSIYAASYRAMERMIASSGFGPDEAEAERARVAEVIERVEGEYAAYYGSGEDMPLPADRSGDAAPASRTAAAEDAHRAASHDTRARTPASFAPPPAAGAPAAEPDVWRPGGGAKAPSRRGPGRHVLLALVLVVVLALLLMAGTFLFGGSAEEEGEGAAGASSATPAATETAGGQADGEMGAVPWIDVFSGANIEQVSTPSGARVASVDEAGRSAIRISGPQGGEGEVMINLGPGLVERIAGADVRVEIVAGSPDGSERQFSVRCMFGDASVCERQSFITAMPEEAFVFDVAIPGGAGSPANLAIGPSVSQDGPELDVYSVRMRVL